MKQHPAEFNRRWKDSREGTRGHGSGRTAGRGHGGHGSETVWKKTAEGHISQAEGRDATGRAGMLCCSPECHYC